LNGVGPCAKGTAGASSRKSKEWRRRWLAKAERMASMLPRKRAPWPSKKREKCLPACARRDPCRGGRHHNTGVKEVRTTPIRVMGLSLVLLGAVGVVWLTSSPGANTMAKADESGKPRRSELRKRLSSLQY